MLQQKTIEAIDYLIQKGENKHGPMDTDDKCLGALVREVFEVIQAMQERKPWKVRAELLDCANVCIRRAQTIDVEGE